MMKQLHWACTARAARKCEKCHFAFSASLPFFRFFDCDIAPAECDIQMDKTVASFKFFCTKL